MPQSIANVYVKLQMDDAREAVAKIDVDAPKAKQPARPARRRGTAGE